MGTMLPWHLDDVQRTSMCRLRDRLEQAIDEKCSDGDVIGLLEDTARVARGVAQGSIGAPNVYARMDRARLTIECILERCRKMIKC